MIDQKILSEKYKYLIMSYLDNNYELLSLDVDSFVDNDGKINEYVIDLTFDYKTPIDTGISDFTHTIEKIEDYIYKVLSEFQITPEGKIVRNKDIVTLHRPILFNIDYSLDEKFILNFNFNCEYK